MKKPVAVIVKFFNEEALLPRWRDHYFRQVGRENCYMLDHGSNDGSQRLTGGANVIRLMRSEQNDYIHLDLVRTLAEELLKTYRYVLHVDIDELVVADPAQYSSLADYAARCEHPIVTMIGLELQHVIEREPALDDRMPILTQRRHAWFHGSMCKPALTSGPLDWSPGFHCMPHPTVFDDLYLFHLRYADRDIGLRRLYRSRNQPWSHPDQAPHQRMADEPWLAMIADFGAPGRLSDIPAETAAPEMAACQAAFIASRAGRERNDYKIDLDIKSAELWRVPDRFAPVF